MTAQFVLDKVVEKEQLSVNEQELTEHIIRTASRYGMGPDQFAQQVVQAGQVPVLVSEVVRGKALALVLEQAKVVDESGRPVDLEALREDARPPTPSRLEPLTMATPMRRHRPHRSRPRLSPYAGHEGPCRSVAAGPSRVAGDAACADSEHPPGGEFRVQAPR